MLIMPICRVRHRVTVLLASPILGLLGLPLGLVALWRIGRQNPFRGLLLTSSVVPGGVKIGLSVR